MIYGLLFISTFISATLFPLGSEALLLFNLEEGYSPVLLLLFASLGNILGSGVNYWLGFKGEEFLEKKKILKAKQIERAKNFFDKYGGYSLLLAWVPIIGDPITFIAGILKYDIKKFFIFVAISKTGRYLFLYIGWLGFTSF